MPKGKNKKVIGLIKNVGLRSKNYSYLIDDGSKEKKKQKA